MTVLVPINMQLTPAVLLFPACSEVRESKGSLFKVLFPVRPLYTHRIFFFDIFTSRVDIVDECSLLYWNSSCYFWLSQPTPD